MNRIFSISKLTTIAQTIEPMVGMTSRAVEMKRDDANSAEIIELGDRFLILLNGSSFNGRTSFELIVGSISHLPSVLAETGWEEDDGQDAPDLGDVVKMSHDSANGQAEPLGTMLPTIAAVIDDRLEKLRGPRCRSMWNWIDEVRSVMRDIPVATIRLEDEIAVAKRHLANLEKRLAA